MRWSRLNCCLVAILLGGCLAPAERKPAALERELAMEHLKPYFEIEGDSFDKLSPLAAAIQKRIENAGLSAWESPETELEKVSTWEERAVVRLVSFYCVCSSSGRVHPHLDHGLWLCSELEAVGAHSTLRALRELDALRRSGVELGDGEQVSRIEKQVPGDFDWADPILEYVRSHPRRFLRERE